MVIRASLSIAARDDAHVPGRLEVENPFARERTPSPFGDSAMTSPRCLGRAPSRVVSREIEGDDTAVQADDIVWFKTVEGEEPVFLGLEADVELRALLYSERSLEAGPCEERRGCPCEERLRGRR